MVLDIVMDAQVQSLGHEMEKAAAIHSCSDSKEIRDKTAELN
ncbi:uncharacterized protein ARMOST_18064 [Armillaria ostoyae]|uniref:Uncharacterized protein n=1 Tax=Armillaria ostoyae TaxID=47428 RepID=A0A284S0Q6_ARMOS|nr:uncharacterized protein ARMOST_18064 [Armillaria ostoyae]